MTIILTNLNNNKIIFQTSKNKILDNNYNFHSNNNNNNNLLKPFIKTSKMILISNNS